MELQQVKPTYAAVYVLLISWTNDDLNVQAEVDQLAHIFSKAYGFLVERFSIPDHEPDDSLAECLSSFVRKYQSSLSLLIAYYAGHGELNDSRLLQWACNRNYDSPQLKWYSHQRILEDSLADVLLILDCCQPLGGGGNVRRSTGKQVLAACGFGSAAPGVGEHSFSRALIQELLRSVRRPFAVSELHHRILNRLRSMVPDHGGEHRETPVLEIMGEGGLPDHSILLTSYDVHPVNLIALMGVTGSGKSSLINKICGSDVAEVGEGQESMTKEVRHFTTIVNGETITLIDTPGFDDTYLSDRMVLERISTYLLAHYHAGRKLNGLLYLRDINTPRMTGAARKNLDLFNLLCGEESLPNVMLLTTKWDKPAHFAEGHFKDLQNKFWKDMIDLGCREPKRLGATVDRALDIQDPITDVIKPILRFKPTDLQIQRELAAGHDLLHTAAGKKVDKDLTAEIEEQQAQAKSALVQAKASHQAQLKDALQKQAEEHKLDIKKAVTDRNALKNDFDQVMRSEAERRSQLFGYDTVSRLDDIVSSYLEGHATQQGNGEVVYFTPSNVGIGPWTVGCVSAGIFEAYKYIWKKQGRSKELIDSAESSMAFFGSV